MIRYALITITVLFSWKGSAQSVEQFLQWANEAKQVGDHRGRAAYYEQVLKREPGLLTHQWELAEAYRKSNQCDKAAALYKRIARKDLRKMHPDARMYQALMEQCDLRPKDAQTTWQQVLKNEKKRSGYRALKAKNALLSIAMMDSLVANKVDVQLERLGGAVNTCYSEMSPRILNDKLFYTTTNPTSLGLNSQEGDTSNVMGITISEKTADGWGSPAPFRVDTGAFVGNTALTSEGHLLFSRQTIEGTKLFMVRNDQSGSGKAASIISINKKGNNTKPMVADFQGQQTLFFTSDRQGGQGGWDIWMADINDGVVSKVRALNTPVNTKGDEASPFYDEVNQKLYFASDFHPGMGGFDLFSSSTLDNQFTTPVNLGYPLNTERDERYPAFYPELGLGFFSRIPFEASCCEGNNCCPDIYQFQYNRDTIPEDTLTNAMLLGSSQEVQHKLRELLPIRLYFHNDEPNPRTRQITTPYTYEQTYLKYRELIPRYQKEQGSNSTRITAINDFFTEDAEGNFLKLNRYLDLLQLVLQQGDTVKITIRGFASPLAKSDYNVNLSLRRISSLQNYLRSYAHGALLPYLNSTAPQGQLIIVKAPYGESTSETSVSDEVTDLKNSVYSRGAALERRIELESIELFSANPTTDTLSVSKNIGKVLQHTPQDIEFLIEHTNDIPLKFIEVDADCGCTTVKLPTNTVAPGERIPITVRFNGKAPTGPFQRRVYLTTNGEPKVITLEIEGVILPLR